MKPVSNIQKNNNCFAQVISDSIHVKKSHIFLGFRYNQQFMDTEITRAKKILFFGILDIGFMHINQI